MARGWSRVNPQTAIILSGQLDRRRSKVLSDLWVGSSNTWVKFFSKTQSQKSCPRVLNQIKFSNLYQGDWATKTRGSYSTIAFHVVRIFFKRRGKLMFSSKIIAVRDLYLPEGDEKALDYECLSLKTGEHHVEIRHTLQVLGICLECQVLCTYSTHLWLCLCILC